MTDDGSTLQHALSRAIVGMALGIGVAAIARWSHQVEISDSNTCTSSDAITPSGGG